MAAAEYYNGGGGAPTSHPHHTHQQNLHVPQSSGTPYPISDAPPPYTPYAEPRPHSQPPPNQRPVQPSGSYHAPIPQSNYPSDKYGHKGTPPLQNMYRPEDFNPAYRPPPQQQPQQHQQQQPPPPPQQQGHFYPGQGPPAMQQAYGGNNNASANAFQRPTSSPAQGPGRPQGSYHQHHHPGRSRSRSRSRSRHRKPRHDRAPPDPRKKSNGVNTFLGAGGGALIGDAIFPGLGTLGGAILGGFGGHEYGKRRSQSHPHRHRDRSYSNDGPYYENDSRRGRKY